MLDLKAIQFTTAPDQQKNNVVHVTGRLVITVDIPIDIRRRPPISLTQDTIREGFWYHAYGELKVVAAEIQTLAAQLDPSRPDYPAIQAQVDKLNELLTLKQPR